MALVVKNSPAMQQTQETWVQFLGREDPLRRKWQPTPIFLPGKFHGQWSMEGYSPWGHKELGTLCEELDTHTHTSIKLQVNAVKKV